MQWRSNLSKTFSEKATVVKKAKETVDIFHCIWCRKRPDTFELIWIGGNARGGNNITKKVPGNSSEEPFGWFVLKAGFAKAIKD